MAITPVSSAASTQGTTGISRVNTENGKVVINYKGEKYSLTPKQADQYNELLYGLNYAKNKIDSLKTELNAKGTSESRKAEIQKELKPLQEQYAAQQRVASFDILPSASGDMFVKFTMKEEVDAEEFKKIFNLKDGSLRAALKKEALNVDVTGDGNTMRHYDDAWYDSRLVEDPYSANSEFEFDNGVVLRASDDSGHYYPDYTKAVLFEGQEVGVAHGAVKDPEKSWWEFWK